jgi:hypothetical protein
LTTAKAERASRRQSGAEQSRLFIEAARDLACDDDKERFEKRLGKIAKAKATPKK